MEVVTFQAEDPHVVPQERKSGASQGSRWAAHPMSLRTSPREAF